MSHARNVRVPPEQVENIDQLRKLPAGNAQQIEEAAPYIEMQLQAKELKLS
jgi:hypothetical protein